LRNFEAKKNSTKVDDEKDKDKGEEIGRLGK
jgi:hypothetical protein